MRYIHATEYRVTTQMNECGAQHRGSRGFAIYPPPPGSARRGSDFIVSVVLASAIPFQSSLGVANVRTKVKTRRGSKGRQVGCDGCDGEGRTRGPWGAGSGLLGRAGVSLC